MKKEKYLMPNTSGFIKGSNIVFKDTQGVQSIKKVIGVNSVEFTITVRPLRFYEKIYVFIKMIFKRGNP